MVEKSWRWATARGRIRTNEMHGVEEAKLVLEENFAENTETGEMNHLESNGLFEARFVFRKSRQHDGEFRTLTLNHCCVTPNLMAGHRWRPVGCNSTL